MEFVAERENYFLTASADKTIRLWNQSESIRTFTGHQDVVRCLQCWSDKFFVSAGNDSTIRLWNFESGKCEQTLESSSGEFIYRLVFKTSLIFPSFSMSMIQTPECKLIATCGEGGYIEFFEASDVGLSYYQTQRTPTSSLWSIKPLPNGDVAVAAK